jgi:transcriptional regulator PpsR
MELSPRKTGSQFRSPKKSMSGLDAVEVGKLVAASADIALVLDAKGIIRDIALGNDELTQDGADAWLGRPWIETVTLESRPKVAEILAEAGASSASRWRHVNHPSPRGPDLPVRYSALRIESQGRVVAVGRDLRAMAALQQRLFSAQQSLEREYARLSHGENRYRLLFQISSEAVVIVDASNQRVVEMNPAAERLLAKKSRRAVGRPFLEAFDAARAGAVESLLDTVKVAGRGEDVVVRLADSPDPHLLQASLFRQENASHFLVRLTNVGTSAEASSASKSKSTLLKVVQNLPDGFVVTDPEGRILSANPSFLDLAQIATEDRARTLSLDQFIGEPGVDFNVMAANLRQHGLVRNFATRVQGENGGVEEVEVTAVAALTGELPCFGFTIRAASRRGQAVRSAKPSQAPLNRSVEQLTELVGRVSLKELVRESTDIIERLCIEAALELTNDNRASAADMLGLSRQSLYVKLRRYGLGELDSDE